MRNCCHKKGVSLVTVLIFMMIATIAATATYKWLSSAGFTSADRMAVAEAKESSRAGLEAVRSWMTFHSNDVGAIVRQYFDGKKKPVDLGSLVYGMERGKQRFAVWLTGVDNSSPTYKFTVVSTGYSRTDTKYSEVAVLNVRGLYKVEEPGKVEARRNDFHYSYFGGSTGSTQDVNSTSMLINGNWFGNPAHVDSNFIVTGNAELSGNNIQLGMNNCIGGDLKIVNEGMTAHNIYVHGDVLQIKGLIIGDAYFNGSVSIAQTGDDTVFVANQDVTINKDLKLVSTSNHEIDGNFCMGEEGTLDLNNLQRTFKSFGGIKFLNPSNPIMGASVNSDMVLLGDEGGKRWIENVACEGEKCTSGSATFVSRASAADVSSDVTCSEEIKEHCLDLLGKETEGCDGSKFKIDDVLTTSYEEFRKREMTNCLTDFVSNYNENEIIKKLNECYQASDNSEELFHGFLVVNMDKIPNFFRNKPNVNEGENLLIGRFIFYSDVQQENIYFPPTAEDSYAFVYLGLGAKSVNAMKGGENYNYFFYSKGNIESLLSEAECVRKDDNSGACVSKWTGSFYMTAENCAKITKMEMANQYLEYNEKLVQLLLDSAIVCDISEGSACGYSTSKKTSEEETPPASTGGEDFVEGYDRFYVATSPRLSVILESQRKLNGFDEPSEFTTVKPSIVVLPRIVYLDQQPNGKLADYYNVLYLNGAKKSEGTTSCFPVLPTSGPLTTEGSKLENDIYKCTYSSDEYSNPFWVIVNGESDGVSSVQFTEPGYVQINSGEKDFALVNVVVNEKQQNPVTATIKTSEMPDGWHVDAQGAVAKTSDGMFTVTLNPGSTTPVLKVWADDNAERGQVDFFFDELSNNARVGSPNSFSVQMIGEGSVKREDISKNGDCYVYDGNSNASEHSEIVPCSEAADLDDCPDDLAKETAGEWIVPNCKDPVTLTPNNSWSCNYAGVDKLKLVPGMQRISKYCDVYISDAAEENPVNSKEYTLYASRKLKTKTVKVVLTGADKSIVRVRKSKDKIGADNLNSDDVVLHSCTANGDSNDDFKNQSDTCRYKVPINYHLSFEHVENDNEHFVNWTLSGSAPGAVSSKPVSSNPLNIVVDNDTVVVASFSENDEHCFYSTFEETGVWCKGTTNNCFDICEIDANENIFCETEGGGMQPSSDWLLPRVNNIKEYSELQKEGGNLLYYDAGKNKSSGKGVVSYVLNRTIAGGHGKLTSQFIGCTEMNQNNQKHLNSGFILRSNANAGKYAIVNVLGTPEGSLKAKTCTGDGTGIKVAQNDCVEAIFPGIMISFDKLLTTMLTAEIDVPKGSDSAKVTVSYKNAAGKRVESRVSLKLGINANSDGRQYVGLSLADQCFQVLNVGWEPYDWPGGCSSSNIPSLECSFAANYLGGALPLGEEVSPWVGTSSWFNDPDNPYKLREGCTISYHYNGCDVDPSYSTFECVESNGSTNCSPCSADKEGPSFVTGLAAQRMKSDKFVFTYEGPHGYNRGGASLDIVRDVSVVVDCGDEGVFTQSCGNFTVGSQSSCEQNINFRIGDCINTTSCTVDVIGNPANLRSSTLMGKVEGLPEDRPPEIVYEVSIELVDVDGNTSLPIAVRNGGFWRDLLRYSDNEGFNLNRVKSLKLTSNEKFSLTSLSTSCTNAIGVKDCNAQFDGKSIVIGSKMQNAQSAKCKVSGIGEGSNYNVSETDCPSTGEFVIPAMRLQEEINAGGDFDHEYVFTITMTSKENPDIVQTCTTPAMTLGKNALNCHFDDYAEKVLPGEDLPPIHYSVSNCPAGGCLVEAGLQGGRKVEIPYQYGDALWNPNGKAVLGETYTYELSYQGATCSKSFTVKAPAEAESFKCYIEETNGDIVVANKTQEGVYFTLMCGDDVVEDPSFVVGGGDVSKVDVQHRKKFTSCENFVVVENSGSKRVLCSVVNPLFSPEEGALDEGDKGIAVPSALMDNVQMENLAGYPTSFDCEIGPSSEGAQFASYAFTVMNKQNVDGVVDVSCEDSGNVMASGAYRDGESFHFQTLDQGGTIVCTARYGGKVCTKSLEIPGS